MACRGISWDPATQPWRGEVRGFNALYLLARMTMSIPQNILIIQPTITIAVRIWIRAAAMFSQKTQHMCLSGRSVRAPHSTVKADTNVPRGRAATKHPLKAMASYWIPSLPSLRHRASLFLCSHCSVEKLETLYRRTNGGTATSHSNMLLPPIELQQYPYLKTRTEKTLWVLAPSSPPNSNPLHAVVSLQMNVMCLEIPVYLYSGWWLSLEENFYYTEALKGKTAPSIRSELAPESCMGLAVCYYSQMLLQKECTQEKRC